MTWILSHPTEFVNIVMGIIVYLVVGRPIIKLFWNVFN